MSAGAPRSLVLGRVAGALVSLHWSFPLGVVLLAGGLGATGLSALAALALLFVHAAGHWLLARALGVTVDSVRLSGLGGAVTWRGVAGPLGGPLEAWGGVAAQLLVLLGASALPFPPGSALGSTLLERNMWLVALNLLPLPGFDGADAWALPWRLGRRLRAKLVGAAADDDAPPSEPLDVPLADDEPAGPKAAEARRIAEALLENARRGPPEDEP